MATSDFAEAKAYLTKNVSGNNLYDHLSEVLLKLVSEKPDQSLELFEHLSMVVKQAKFKPGNGLEGAKMDATAAQEDGEIAMAEWSTKTASAFGEIGDKAIGEDLDEKVADTVTELSALEWANVGYGKEESWLIDCAVRKLALNTVFEAAELRFWGKVLGTSADYYVIQGKCENRPEGEDANERDQAIENGEIENGEEGPNRWTYFVANALEGDWVRLPDVRASELVAACQLTRFFTGSLDAAVKGHPPFKGTEKNYLRAQIARISAESELCPDGWYIEEEVDGEQNKLNDNESREVQVDSLFVPDQWKIAHAAINETTGRCVPMPEAGSDEPVAAESRLRALVAEDWRIKKPCASRITLRSIQWPGAAVVAYANAGNPWAWSYSGYGQKKPTATSYTPTPPSRPQAEFSSIGLEVVEQPDKLTAPPEADGDE